MFDVPQIIGIGATDTAELLSERTVILADIANNLTICSNDNGVVRSEYGRQSTILAARTVRVSAPTRNVALLHKLIQFGRKDFSKSLINKANGNNGDVFISILHAFLQRIA